MTAVEYQVGNGRVFLTSSPDPIPMQKFGTTAYTGNTVGGSPLGEVPVVQAAVLTVRPGDRAVERDGEPRVE